MKVYLLIREHEDGCDIHKVFSTVVGAVAFAVAWDGLYYSHPGARPFRVCVWIGDGPGVLAGRDSFGEDRWTVTELLVES